MPDTAVTNACPITCTDAAVLSLDALNITSPKVERAITIAVYGDTHNKHALIKNPPACDLLIHVGDFTGLGTVNEICSFTDWIRKAYPSTPIIVIDGNHERFKKPAYVYSSPDRSRIPASQEAKERLFQNANIHYLASGQSVEIFGLTITGLPWENDGDSAYQQIEISQQTNIMVSHCPPKGFLDREKTDDPQFGSEVIKDKILGLPNLSACFFGHAHLARGALGLNKGDGKKLLLINAAMAGGPGYSERIHEGLADCMLVQVYPES